MIPAGIYRGHGAKRKNVNENRMDMPFVLYKICHNVVFVNVFFNIYDTTLLGLA